MKTKPWHDRMVTIWVTPETRKALNDLRDPMRKIRTVDDVIEILLKSKQEGGKP